MPGWRFSGYRRPEHLTAPQPRPAPPATEAPKPAPLPTLDWANPVHTNGACTCDVIYSECRCIGTNISAQTNPADFHSDQQ